MNQPDDPSRYLYDKIGSLFGVRERERERERESESERERE